MCPRFLVASCTVAALLSFIPFVSAQTTRPALAQLAQDVQSLYRDAEAGTVRVRVPLPMLAGLHDARHPLNKWAPQLDADVRERLRESRLEGPVRIRVERAPEGQPTTNPATTQPTTGESLEAEQVIRFDLMSPQFPSNEHVGLVLDDKGHVLVHCYIDPSRVDARRPIRATAGGKTVEAIVVGADKKTRLTVLRLAQPLGKPLPARPSSPQSGELVMMLAGGGQAPSLVLWNDRNKDHGLVLGLDGAVAGFSHGGQLLNEGNYRPIVQQLIQHGVVKRAKLGAYIETVATDDAIRHQVPALGHRPAIRVQRVVPNSAAQAAGLRENDIILSLAGEPVSDVFAFAATIAHCSGATELKVLRGGEPLTVTAELRPE